MLKSQIIALHEEEKKVEMQMYPSVWGSELWFIDVTYHTNIELDLALLHMHKTHFTNMDLVLI